MDYVGLSWVEFLPSLVSFGLFTVAYFACKKELIFMWNCDEHFLVSLIAILVSLLLAMPLLLSFCFGCLLPNSPDDIQCAAVINASKNVLFVKHSDDMPETDALVIKDEKEHPGFSVWKDNIMLFDASCSRRRSKKAFLSVTKRQQEPKDQTEEDQTEEEQKRQEIIKEILYANT